MTRLIRECGYFLLSACIVTCLTGCRNAESAVSNITSNTNTAENEDIQETIPMPYELSESRITVYSLFQSSVENPDCGNLYADDIATLEFENTSDSFLTSATFTVQMPDGTEISFAAENIPAGRKCWVFASDNAAISTNTECVSITCDAVFSDESLLLSDVIEYEVNDMDVTLHNLSDESVTGLTIGCHCLFDDIYFGGVTYFYTVEEIPADTYTFFSAYDCFLGCAEVVSIELTEQ